MCLREGEAAAAACWPPSLRSLLPPRARLPVCASGAATAALAAAVLGCKLLHKAVALLRCQAQRFARRGATFIKLEVDETNTGAERFYNRLGFGKKTEDRLHILEQDKFKTFVSKGGTT